MGRRWTDQDIDQLKRMAQRYPAPKIAELTTRTVGGVVHKAHQLKLSLRLSRKPLERTAGADTEPTGFEWAEIDSRQA